MNRRRLIIPCAAGGLFYSLGAVVNATGWPTLIPGIWGPHETLHFAVLAGLACHWLAVSQVIDRETQEKIDVVKARLIMEVFERFREDSEFKESVEAILDGRTDPYTACDGLVLSTLSSDKDQHVK